MENTTKEPKTPADKKVAFSLKISRTLDGVEIYAKSAAMSDLVRRALSAGESENHEQYGGPIWTLSDTGENVRLRLPSGRFAAFSRAGWKLPFSAHEVNVSWLRSVALADGVTIVYRGLYTVKDVKEYARDVRAAVVEFVTEYMGVYRYSVEITADGKEVA